MNKILLKQLNNKHNKNIKQYQTLIAIFKVVVNWHIRIKNVTNMSIIEPIVMSFFLIAFKYISRTAHL